jgi:cytochrome c-type biogenesis protein CcmH/NrfG
VQLYADAARRRPEDPERLSRLGRALLHVAGRAEDAEAALRASLRLRPGHAATLVDLGQALGALGRHVDAVAAFEEALGSDPEVLARRPASRNILDAARRGVSWPAP